MGLRVCKLVQAKGNEEGITTTGCWEENEEKFTDAECSPRPSPSGKPTGQGSADIRAGR